MSTELWQYILPIWIFLPSPCVSFLVLHGSIPSHIHTCYLQRCPWFLSCDLLIWSCCIPLYPAVKLAPIPVVNCSLLHHWSRFIGVSTNRHFVHSVHVSSLLLPVPHQLPSESLFHTNFLLSSSFLRLTIQTYRIFIGFSVTATVPRSYR